MLFRLKDVLVWLEKNTQWITLDGHYNSMGRLTFYAAQGYHLLLLSAPGRTVEARIFGPTEFDFHGYRTLLRDKALRSTEEKQPESVKKVEIVEREPSVEEYRRVHDAWAGD